MVLVCKGLFFSLFFSIYFFFISIILLYLNSMLSMNSTNISIHIYLYNIYL